MALLRRMRSVVPRVPLARTMASGAPPFKPEEADPSFGQSTQENARVYTVIARE